MPAKRVRLPHGVCGAEAFGRTLFVHLGHLPRDRSVVTLTIAKGVRCTASATTCVTRKAAKKATAALRTRVLLIL